MRKLLLSAFVASVIAAPAMAADMPFKAPEPICVWCGFYVGGNFGYGFGQARVNGNTYYTGNLGAANAGTTGLWSLSDNLSGFVGGGQLGYNFQINPTTIVGIEADFQAAGLGSSGNAVTAPTIIGANGLISHFGAASNSERLDWFGTLRGRLGGTPFANNVMLYATGGIAAGRVKGILSHTESFPTVPAGIVGAGEFNAIRLGWTAGAGVEWMAPVGWGRWSFKLEYLYTELGGIDAKVNVNTLAFGNPGFPTFIASQSSLNRFSIVRLGVNYHFN
jgi:outer membrane immunogenic protein